MNGLTKEERLEIAATAFRDPIFFCKYFLAHLFPDEIPWVHRGIWAILTRRTDFLEKYGEVDKIIENFVIERNGEKVPIFRRGDDGVLRLFLGENTLLMLPRGFSKTTLMGDAESLYDILYQISGVQLYVSASGSHASTRITNIQRELETNRRIVEIFGNLKPSGADSNKWNAWEFETTTGQVMIAKGIDAQVRGVNYFGKRPAKIKFDDLEDKESVATKEQRAKMKEKAYSDLFPCIAEMAEQKSIYGMGTLLHRDSLLAMLCLDPDWTVVKFGARDRQGDLLWERNLNEAKLEAKKRSYALMGRLDLFYMEYFNEVRNDDTAKFRPDMFQYLNPDDELKYEDYSIAMFLDPAIGQRRKSDSSVNAVVGMHQKTGKIVVFETWGKQGALPREQIDTVFRLYKKYRPQKVGVESNAYQAALVHLIREEMFRNKFYFEIQAVTHHTKNAERIMGILQPRYAAKYIWHNGPLAELETQLLDFKPESESTHDDYPTAVAGGIALLDPYAAHAAGDTDLAVDEYEPLDEALIFGAP